MKKSLIRNLVFGSAAVAGIFLMAQTASAAIGGRCDKCHTMHNSQDGLDMVSTGTGTNPAQEYLLMFNCTNCHTGASGASPVNAATDAPAVMHDSAPGSTSNTDNALAGGSFYWVSNTGYEFGHNVNELTTSEADPRVGNPPGDTGSTNFSGAVLQCYDSVSGAQTNGCHYGGGHHENTGGDFLGDGDTTISYVSGTSVGDSYRFLSAGTYGGEDSDWEHSYSDTDHNIYAGDEDITGATAGTITLVCVRCHGDFHGTYAADLGTGTTAASPWYRHPTDIGLFSAGAGVDTEHQSYGTYSVLTPIAKDVTDITKTQTDEGTVTDYDNAVGGTFDRVSCVSCHRAHGSPFADMLRWSYNTMVAGAATPAVPGCFKCHTDKDAP